MRYSLIDYKGLRNLLGFGSGHELAIAYSGWIEESLKEGNHYRDKRWTESVAVGGKEFVMVMKVKLGIKAKGLDMIGGNGEYELREPPAAYNSILGHENAALRLQNEYFWEDYSSISI